VKRLVTAHHLPRRGFLVGVSVGAGSLALSACGKHVVGDEGVTPTEDLMREHGILRRVLGVYEASLARLGQTDLGVFAKAAEIVRRFVEDYHEKTEEEFLFPKFESAGKLVPLVTTLRKQHQRGRALTDEITNLCRSGGTGQAAVGDRIRAAVTAFAAMYRPHAAREDTVLFPAFRELVSEKEFESLGERFEEREHKLFGERGFEHTVTQVAELELAAGISDLDHFTPA
jgi:hemerythrin-like domain-containing protein